MEISVISYSCKQARAVASYSFFWQFAYTICATVVNKRKLSRKILSRSFPMRCMHVNMIA